MPETDLRALLGRIAAVAAVAGLLAGCSHTPKALLPTPSLRATALPTGVPSAAASLIASDALSDQGCLLGEDGRWDYQATLTNHGQAKATFTVAIGLTVSTAVVGSAVVTKTLGPGESAQVSAPGFAKDTPTGAVCDATVSKEN
jgi:hypothetical protein